MPVTYKTNFDFKHMKKRLEQSTRRMSREISHIALEEVKSRIPENVGDATNGFEAKYDFLPEKRHPGQLHRAVVLLSDKRTGNGNWAAGVTLRAGSPAAVYVMIHERGGWIKAKSERGMSFYWNGKWAYNRSSVYIHKKAPFEKGYKATLKRVNKQFLDQFIDDL